MADVEEATRFRRVTTQLLVILIAGTLLVAGVVSYRVRSASDAETQHLIRQVQTNIEERRVEHDQILTQLRLVPLRLRLLLCDNHRCRRTVHRSIRRVLAE